MFCPDCGIENVKSQKFCARCGSNLLAIDRAREILGEAAAGAVNNSVNPSTVLKTVAFVAIFGLMFITMGTIFLFLIDEKIPQLAGTFGVAGMGTLVLICRALLRLATSTPRTLPAQPLVSQAYLAPARMVPGQTNRRLSEAAVPFNSVTEESTRQFEAER